MRKVAKDKKSVSDVNHIVKKSNTKLSELQAELRELDSVENILAGKSEQERVLADD